MPFYAVLGNWTEQGIREVKRAPERAEALRKAVEAAGGKVVVTLYTIGPHDFVSVLELPSDDVANQLLLRTGMQGFARTTTLKGWSVSEFSQLVHKL